MEKYQDLEILIKESEQLKFINSIKDNQHWKRNLDKEKSFNQDGGGARGFIFDKTDKIGCKPCTVFLFPRDNELRIGNITIHEDTRNRIKDYNECVNNFRDFISTYIKSDAIRVTSSAFDLLDYLSEESKKRLELFSHEANKSTGSAHPSDNERWLAFIIQSHLDGKIIPTDSLKRWLIEEEGWQPEIVSDLVIEYEQGLSLLSAYDNYK
ncbi:hypothetical protein [Acetobacter pasteurianus]|uniref:hypothetical protein n=1 Tax=Acetobacter pasteurianus TaxID=438 RepID=UPI000F564F60|nr:hypothetical protein [Acetobacter pasteurianus]GCD56588.1 hypothetical protein NBRC3222_1925 [Acetobacter pasteurianus NBRC 3222]